ncbi:MAG: hypothetical protein DHS20C15_12840 [Planctomycetota bacterium]|nr:MAG: hypothetical protein DHS20C15_12840 [Planctomycetota bacterium]
MCVLLAGLVLTSAAAAQLCDPEWQPTFGGIAGLDRPGFAFATFDDGLGSGEQLYVGGRFESTSGLSDAGGLARWDGAAWDNVGGALDSSFDVQVHALAVFDDGGGDALYVGGEFQTADGLSTGGLARWDGANWSALGTGILGSVYALEVFDDGSGPALFAGGVLVTAGGQAASGIARWDGSTWSSLAGGVDFDFATSAQPQVRALRGFDDGSGSKLYATGHFTVAGGSSARSIARWDGSAWSNLGPGLGAASSLGVGACLEIYDDGGGDALYVGGNFREIQGAGEVRSVAKWNGFGGGGYSKLGTGLSLGGLQTLDNLVAADFAVYQGRLWVTGSLTSAGGSAAGRLANWDGSSWASPAASLGGGLYAGSPKGFALLPHDDGSGEKLFLAGDFEVAGGVDAFHVTAWGPDGYERLGPLNLDDRVRALAEFDDGGGPVLFAGGEFNQYGDTSLRGIARFVDGVWQPLGTGLAYFGFPGTVRALAVFDDGSGSALYAGGRFTLADGMPAAHIARWDGSQWAALPGAPLDDEVHCLRVLDLGNGPELFAGGYFKAPARHVARWTGNSWRDVGGGVFDNNGAVPSVLDMAAYDDGRGDGPVLYVTGQFLKAGLGVPAQRIARWNGVGGWSAVGEVGEVGSLISQSGFALAVFDDGEGFGPELYLAGSFDEIDGAEAVGIAKWNGVRWAALGDGLTFGPGFHASGTALAVHDDGSGPALFVGGTFNMAGMQSAPHVARWDGLWSSLGDGASDDVHALLASDDATGADAALYAGGAFLSVPGSGDSYVARWAGCAVPPSPWEHLGHGLWNGTDQAPLLQGTGSLQPASAGAVELSLAAASAPTLLFASLASDPIAFKGGTLVPFPATLIKAFTTNASGSRSLAFASFPSGLAGLIFDMQFAIQDFAAAQNVSLSNALRAHIP